MTPFKFENSRSYIYSISYYILLSCNFSIDSIFSILQSVQTTMLKNFIRTTQFSSCELLTAFYLFCFTSISKTSILQYFTGKSFIFYQSLTWYNSFFQLFVFYSLHLSPKEFIFCFTASSGKAKGLQNLIPSSLIEK